MIDTSHLFPDLPPESRAWIYVSDRILTASDELQLADRLDEFSRSWSSHGRRVESGFRIFEHRVLVVAALVREGELSGCGIDKSLHVIEGFAGESSFGWVDGLHTIRRKEDGLVVESRNSFRQNARSGTIDGNTMILDPALPTLGDIRTRGLERRAVDSWHARLLEPTPTTAG